MLIVLAEMFRIQLANKQCRHIFFAGCHDNGYLTILEQFKHDNETASRITLLETLPAPSGFYALNFKMARFPSVFRSESLEQTPSQNHVQTQDGSSTNIIAQIAKSKTPPVEAKSDLSPQVKTAANNTAVQKPPVAPKTPTPGSWASAAVANGTNGKTVTVARPKKPAITRFILYNYDGYRLDTTLSPPSSNDIHNLHALMEKGKLCNEHFIKGKCTNPNCKYLHTGKLSAGELNALKHKARRLACPNKIGCDDYGCYCGHICPYARNGKCLKDGCHFEDVHGIDRVSSHMFIFMMNSLINLADAMVQTL
jgi:hypothetical protein